MDNNNQYLKQRQTYYTFQVSAARHQSLYLLRNLSPEQLQTKSRKKKWLNKYYLFLLICTGFVTVCLSLI